MSKGLIRFSNNCHLLWPEPADIRCLQVKNSKNLYGVPLVHAPNSTVGFSNKGRKVVEQAVKLDDRKATVYWSVDRTRPLEMTLYIPARGIPELERRVSNICNDIQRSLNYSRFPKQELFDPRVQE